MNKKIWIPTIIVVLILAGATAYLFINLNKQKEENAAIKELEDIDNKEMENDYQQFAQQYSEIKTKINHDSIVAQLTAEQEKTQRLLNELRRVKSTDAIEITRLKKELATVRAVIRSYVMEIDSLNKVNANLTQENTRVKGQYEAATRQIEGLSTEKRSLSEKVAIAAQLDATGISLVAKNKRGKATDQIDKATTLQVSFNITRNVTAASGVKDIYVRIMSPTGNLLNGAGSFSYENRTLQYSMKRSVEYNGEETPVTLFWNVSQALVAGTYQVSIFADGNMIGSRSFAFK